MVEQRPFKSLVLGSNPSRPTSLFILGSHAPASWMHIAGLIQGLGVRMDLFTQRFTALLVVVCKWTLLSAFNHRQIQGTFFESHGQ